MPKDSVRAPSSSNAWHKEWVTWSVTHSPRLRDWTSVVHSATRATQLETCSMGPEGLWFQVLSYKSLLIFKMDVKATVLAGLGCTILSLITHSSILLCSLCCIFSGLQINNFYEVLNRIRTINTTLTQKKKILFERAANARKEQESSVDKQ